MKTLNTKKELKEYLKTVNFWLKDFEKTNNKYKNYKKGLSQDMYDAFKNVDFCNIFDNYSQVDYYFNNIVSQVYNEKSKSNIRYLKTAINYRMRQALEKAIEFEFCNNLNDNEKRNLTIKLYIKFYKKINKAMKYILNDYILN